MKKSVKSASAAVVAKAQSNSKSKSIIPVLSPALEAQVLKSLGKSKAKVTAQVVKAKVTAQVVKAKVTAPVVKVAAQMPLPKVPEHRGPGRIAGVIPMSVAIKEFFSAKPGNTVDACIKMVNKQYGGCRRGHVLGVIRDAEHKFGWKRIENSGVIRLVSKSAK